MSTDNNPTIFIAYSRKDEEFLRELRVFLHPLEQNKGVKIWYDGEIVAGEVWETSIKTALHRADIILLLVSANSLASEYFYEKEVQEALYRHQSGICTVIPVILKPCGWEDTPLASLQALPKDGEAITLWNNRDQAYKSVFDGVKLALAKLEARQHPTATPAAPPAESAPVAPVADKPDKPRTTRKTATVNVEKTVPAPPAGTSNGSGVNWSMVTGAVMLVVISLVGYLKPWNWLKKDLPKPVPTGTVVLPQANTTVVQEIVAGKGFGGVEVGETSLADLKKMFGTAFTTKDFNNFSVSVSYPDLGMDFYFDYKDFHSIKPDDAKKIFSIQLKLPFKGRTAKGIILGYSTMSEVEKLYGTQQWLRSMGSDIWKVEYPKAGIRFGVERDKSVPVTPLNKPLHLKKAVDVIEVFSVE
jgi:hypothetical protein